MAKPAIATVVFVLALAAAKAAPVAAAEFTVQRAAVAPRTAFVDSPGDVRVEFRVGAAAPVDVSIRIVGAGGEVRRFLLGQVPPGTEQVQLWDGLSTAGKAVPDGTYWVLIGPPGRPDREAGRVRLRGHFFPVRGPHGSRGAVGEFGAGRNGGRTHKGFDVTAACGTPLAAVRSGTVVKRGFDPRLDGNFIVIRGLGERRTYLYAHMVRPSPFRRGDEVHTGDLVGRIGKTGNAGSTPCHLHFEIHRRGRPIDPGSELRAWDRVS